MAKKTVVSDFETIIGLNTILEGDINTEKSIRIEGKVIGNLTAVGSVFIGKKADIKGNLAAESIHICGKVEGSVNAVGLLKMDSSANLLGDITVNSFVADEGSIFHGNCSMIESSFVKSDNNKKKRSVLEDINNE